MELCEKTYVTSHGSIHYWVTVPQPNQPWLVFLPGLTVDHQLFDKQIAYFQNQYNCLVWDAPAHGASRPFARNFSLDDLAVYLHDILTAETIQQPVLIGQSMGGYIAQAYMKRYPDEAGGFIAIDSAPLKRSYYKTWELFFLKHTKLMYLSIPWKLLISWCAAGNAETAYGRMLMRQMMTAYQKTEFCELAAYGFRIVAEAVELGHPYAISCPTLLLCGEHDRTGFVKRYNQAWVAAEQLPLIWIPGAGHNANTDAPAFVNEQIEMFLNKEFLNKEFLNKTLIR